jgi:hypothetical protein
MPPTVVVSRGSPKTCDAICHCALICNTVVFLYPYLLSFGSFLSIPRVFFGVLLGGKLSGVVICGVVIGAEIWGLIGVQRFWRNLF